MAASLVNQMQYALSQRFKAGASKHAAEQEVKQVTVYSYKYRENLNDFAKDFGRFVKAKHPDVRFVKDIMVKHVDEYLQSKIDSGCSKNYINELRSAAVKMGHLTSAVYNRPIAWESAVKGLEKAQKQQDKLEGLNMVVREQWNRLKSDISGTRGQSALAIEVAGAFGLRVNELTKLTPKDLENEGYLHIHKSKGGRSRDLEIRTDEQRLVIQKLKIAAEDLEPLQKIITIQSDSINKFYREHAASVGIESSSIYGVHQLRRMVATELYHDLISRGLDEKDAENEVSHWLGHGDNRADVISRYVQK